MKRNMTLLRQLVFAIEEMKKPTLSKSLKVKGEFSNAEIVYHCSLLNDAKLIVCDQMVRDPDDGLEYLMIYRLSYAGHDFADEARAVIAKDRPVTK